MNERPPDERIRSWLADGPSHGPPRGLEDLLSRIASTDQARRREVHVPMWLAASLMVGVLVATAIAGGAGYRIAGPLQLPPSASSADSPGVSPDGSGGPCRLMAPIR